MFEKSSILFKRDSTNDYVVLPFGVIRSPFRQAEAGIARAYFPLYSRSSKSVVGFDQRQLTMLGVANDAGENVGLIPGRVVIACIGLGVLKRILTNLVDKVPIDLAFPGLLGSLWLALCVAANSSAWLSTVVLVTNMRNFPISRGTVAVFTKIYSTLLRNSSSKLLMFLALGIPILCFIVMYFVRACTPASGEDSSEPAHFLFTQGALIVLGLYVLTTTVLDHIFLFSALISNTFLVIMVALLMAPFAIPGMHHTRVSKPGMHHQPIKSSDCVILEDNADKTKPENDEASEVAMLLAEGEGATKKKRRPKRGEDFWLLFCVYFVGVGSRAMHMILRQQSNHRWSMILTTKYSSISCLGPNCFSHTSLVLADVCGCLKLQATKLLKVEYDKLRPWEVYNAIDENS
ncbi:unnamed protein product [Dovyalis caffra]|uniref:Nodulin-like domain-containing protein n=1 Tax=Dovyalis caffra TaxID=77055 RepID=A0AAV1RQ95_9ROSI|nr:unnamed protein product [Dovyalis caffra]